MLDELEKNLKSMKKKSISQNKENDTNDEHEKKYINDVLKRLQDEYKQNSNFEKPYLFIENFINHLQTIVGEDIFINNVNISLLYNTYIIDHDHNGFTIDKPIILSGKDERIHYKNNHPFFNADVIYYTSTKSGKIDVFYDAISHILLGYKESSKDFVNIKKNDKKIKIIYSITDRIKLFGYTSKFLNIENKFNSLLKDYIDLTHDTNPNQEIKDGMIKDIISELIRNQIFNLKKIIIEAQRFIYKIKYNVINEKNYKDTHDDPTTVIIDKYTKKLNNIKLTNDKGKHHIYKHWKAITSNIFPSNLDKVDVIIKDLRYFNIDDLSKYDHNSTMLLFYIINELNNLLTFNENKNIKNNIVHFIVEFINYVFSLFNTENLYDNFDIKKFTYMITSGSIIFDDSISGETSGIYEEYKDDETTQQDIEQLNEIENDLFEESEALDIDIEADGDYDASVGEYYPRMFDDWDPSNFYEVSY